MFDLSNHAKKSLREQGYTRCVVGEHNNTIDLCLNLMIWRNLLGFVDNILCESVRHGNFVFDLVLCFLDLLVILYLAFTISYCSNTKPNSCFV